MNKINKKIVAVTTMKTKEVEKELNALEIVFDKTLSLNEKKELLIGALLTQSTVKEFKEENLSEDALKKRATEIIEVAQVHNAVLGDMETEEERRIYIENLQDEIAPAVAEHIIAVFPDLIEQFDTIVVSDLPASQILTNLPVRVIDQMIVKVLVNYPLMGLVQKEMVTNGLKQIFYKDYRDTDDKSGFANVEIGDYNMGTEPVFQETKQVDTEIHKGYDLLSTLLNDVTVTVGLFVGLIKDFVYAIAKPFAKKMYARFVTFLDTTTSYDEIITFTAADAKTKAKEVSNKLVELQTPSRNNLKKKPDGSALALEYHLQSTNANLILNKKYATDYKYDLVAGTFQFGEIKLNVKSITVVDFDRLAEYTENSPATDILKGLEVILVEDGVYQEMVHYSATKQVNTPKLKEVFHRYDRLGNYRRKDKILLGFKS